MNLAHIFAEAGLAFQLFGIPFTIGFGTLFLSVFLFIDARGYIKDQYSWSNNWGYGFAAAVASVLTIVSVGIHELSHALVAWLLGIKVTGGAFTAFGAYVQVEGGVLAQTPGHEMLISVAGPLANFALFFLTAAVVKVFDESLFENTVQYLAYINYRLGKWNLVCPILALDGGKLVHGFLRIFMSDSNANLASMLISVAAIGTLIRRSRAKREDGETEDPVEAALETL